MMCVHRGEILHRSHPFRRPMRTYIRSDGHIVAFLGAWAERSVERHRPERLMNVCHFIGVQLRIVE